MSISSYWAQIFILPTAVINKINSIYRGYLWSCKANDIKGVMSSGVKLVARRIKVVCVSKTFKPGTK